MGTDFKYLDTRPLCASVVASHTWNDTVRHRADWKLRSRLTGNGLNDLITTWEGSHSSSGCSGVCKWPLDRPLRKAQRPSRRPLGILKMEVLRDHGSSWWARRDGLIGMLNKGILHQKFRPSKRLETCHGLIQIKQRTHLTFHQIASIGRADPMNRPNLYYRLSLVWLVVLTSGLAFLLLR